MRTFFTSLTGQVSSALLALLLVSACTLDPAEAPPPTTTLAGTTWELKTIDNQPAPAKQPLTLSFEDTRMGGYSGCNRYFGNYTSSNDGVFSTGPIGATKMACIGERGQQEQHYLELLGKASQYAVSRGQLHLLDTSRKILLVFTAAKPATK